MSFFRKRWQELHPLFEKASHFLLDQARHERSFTLIFIIAAVLMSFLIVLYGMLFRFSEAFYRHLIADTPSLVFILTPVFILGSWHLVRLFAPMAGGGGIPQVMVALDLHSDEKSRPAVQDMMSIRTALVKVASSCLAVLGGAAIGNEGPSVHISSCIFYSIYRLYNKVQPKLDHRIWVVTGSAAGLAATFNTPLGGIVYAIEELGSQHFTKVKTALLIAILIAGTMSQAMLGTYLYFGAPTTYPATLQSTILVVIFAALIGWSGALFGEVLSWAQRKRKQIKGYWKNFFFVLGLSYLIAGIIYINPECLGSGKEYINGLLFTKNEFIYGTPVLRILSTFLSTITGVAGGIFAPAFAMGAGLGKLFIEFCAQFIIYDVHRNLFVLCGMISFLTGMTRAPFTAFILVVEMTDRHGAILPMMLSAVISYYIAGKISDSGTYEKTKEDIIKSLQVPESLPSAG